MNKLVVVVFGIFIAVIGAVNARAQNPPDLWSKIDAFSEASASHDISRAAELAAELANVDFTKDGFTHHESGEFRASFAEALFEAGQYAHAAALLDAVALGDHTAFEMATTPEEKTFYRNIVINRLERRTEMAISNRDGNAEIENLTKVHALNLEALGPDHPELLTLTAKLDGRLRARAEWSAQNGEGISGVNDLKEARRIVKLSNSGRASAQTEIDRLAVTMIEQTSDELVRRGDLDGAISWLEGENDYWSKSDRYSVGLAIKNKLAQLYLLRAERYESNQNFDDAVVNLRLARALGTNLNVTIELAHTLRDSAIYHQQIGKHEKAFTDATEAIKLNVEDTALNAELRAIRERAYRDWNNIPEGQPVNIPEVIPFGRTELVTVPASTNIIRTLLPPFREVRVFYGTNRQRRNEKYSRYRSENLEYGWAKVTVPENRNPGDIPRPFPGFRAQDSKHIILKHSTPYSGRTEFGRQLKSSLLCADLFFFEDAKEPECVAETSKKSELFVFIHGHNVPFANAAMRTAQLAVDLDMEHGAVFFAWPTGRHALDYGTSRDNADESDEKLVEFLNTVIGEANADEIHLIAHSMGNRVLLNALSEIKKTTGANGRPLFDQIIFGSPDVGETDFASSVNAVQSLSNSMTLYASDKDKALKLSSNLPNHEKRAGLTPPSAKVINASTKLVLIDTSELERKFRDLIDHADFTAGAFNDVRGVLWTGASPDKRCALRAARLAPRETYWKALTRNAGCQMQLYGSTIVAARKQNSRPIVRKLSETLLPTRPSRPTISTREDQ